MKISEFEKNRYEELKAKTKKTPKEVMELKKLESLVLPKTHNNEPSLIRSVNSKGRLLYINIYDIKDNPNQPRKHFKDDELTKFIGSVRKEGRILQPILVVEQGNGEYELNAGQKRLLASKTLNSEEKHLNQFEQKWLTIPAYVLSNSDEVSNATRALAENLNRENPFEIDTAKAIEKLYTLMLEKDVLLTQKKFAELVKDQLGGMNESYVSKYLKIATLDQEVIDVIIAQNCNNFSLLYLIAKSKISNVEKIELILRNKDGDASVKDLEDEAKTPMLQDVIEPISEPSRTNTEFVDPFAEDTNHPVVGLGNVAKEDNKLVGVPNHEKVLDKQPSIVNVDFVKKDIGLIERAKTKEEADQLILALIEKLQEMI